MTDLIDQLKQAPTLTPADPDADLLGPEPTPRPTRGRPTRRGSRQPFAEPPPAAARARPAAGEAVFDEEAAAKLKVLWDEYEQRQRAAVGPKTMNYRCIGFRPDGALCGEVVEAGTHEERVRTGEIVRCPHGPDAPAEGVHFDRERYPRWHHELTPMDPIW